MDFYTLSIILFIATLAVLIWRNRKKLEFQGVLVLYRTKRFLEVIESVANKSPRFWKILGSFAVILCFYFMFFGVSYLANSALKVAVGEIKESELKLVLPAPVKSTEIGYAHIFLPFWIWILVIFFILVPHEFAHGIIARVEKVKIKSVGLLLFLIFPGAFVEPDEKQLKRKRLFSKLRVFAAGSFANIVVSFSVFIIGALLWSSVANGIAIEKVVENSPAYFSGLKEGMIIKNINGERINYDFAFYSNFVLSKAQPESFGARIYLLGILTNWTFVNYTFKPGDKITVETDRGNFTVVLSEHPEIENAPYMGIVVSSEQGSFDFLFRFLALLSMLSFAVAVINLLPLYPLDGGQMIKALLEERLEEEKAMEITKTISLFTLFLLLYTFLGPLIQGA